MSDPTQEPYDFKIVVPGEPEAQERHRTTIMPRKGTGIEIDGEKYYRRKDLWVHMYDPSAKAKKDWLRMVMRPPHLLLGPLKVDVSFFWAFRKSDCRTGKYAGQIKPGVTYWKDTGKDRDNCDKFVLDALTGIYWKNDSQVADGRIVKRYTQGRPRTEIYITQIERDLNV